MINLAVLLSGTGSNFKAVSDSIDRGELKARIVLVASNKPDAKGLDFARMKNYPVAIFKRDDWQEFWDIIYGIHPLIEFENKRLPMADRNLSIAEIQKVLIKRYPESFSGFTIEQWSLFWKEIKGIIGHKMQLTGQDEWLQKQKARSDRRLERKMKQDDERISSTVQSVRETISE